MQNREIVVPYGEYLGMVKSEVERKTGLSAQLQMIHKNNGVVLDGLTILAEDTNVSPTIYLNSYYEEFLEAGLDAVVREVLEIYWKNKPRKTFDISRFKNLEKARENIKMKVINYERNVELLEKVPHMKVLDLAVVFMAVLKSQSEYEFASILIYNQHLDYWKVDVEELYKTAQENMKNDFETISLVDVMREVIGDAAEETEVQDMYILTNSTRLHGAVGMLNVALLDAFMKKYQTEKLVILPSSVHEVLLIPYHKGLAGMDFKKMVKEVNEAEVSVEEFLSNSVYEYDGRELKIME